MVNRRLFEDTSDLESVLNKNLEYRILYFRKGHSSYGLNQQQHQQEQLRNWSQGRALQFYSSGIYSTLKEFLKVLWTIFTIKEIQLFPGFSLLVIYIAFGYFGKRLVIWNNLPYLVIFIIDRRSFISLVISFFRFGYFSGNLTAFWFFFLSEWKVWLFLKKKRIYT